MNNRKSMTLHLESSVGLSLCGQRFVIRGLHFCDYTKGEKPTCGHCLDIAWDLSKPGAIARSGKKEG